jgi:hypothetical protein
MARPSLSDFEPFFQRVEEGEAEKENLKKQTRLLECFLSHALQPAGAFSIAKELPLLCENENMEWPQDRIEGAQRAWNLIGHYFVHERRLQDAILIFESLYYQLLRYQSKKNNWIHKAQPLVKISDCYWLLNCPALSKRYFMYTLCEDAIARKGSSVEGSGVYARISAYGMSAELADRYHEVAYHKSLELREEAWFPERLLSELDFHELHWMAEYPTPQELGHYRTNPVYIQHLLENLGTTGGVSLERLAHYLVSMIPGSRVYRRRRTQSGSDYDVVGSFEGPGFDFRSELGRYFLCECKDWSKGANISVMAKTAYFLDSAKCQFGILFSKKGITGKGKKKYAEFEQLKVYASRGIAFVVVSEADLKRLANGENFLSLLRTRYEKVRLGIADAQLASLDSASSPATSVTPSLQPSREPQTTEEKVVTQRSRRKTV